jgi:opacity protein-like surface antigen
LYAGFANLKSTITEKINGSDSGYTSSPSYSNSQTGFALTAGVAVDLNLSQHISLELPIDYAPTFFKQEYYTHKIQNNFRASIGIVFKL